MKKIFYQRYIHLCDLHGLDPCSRRAASLLGTNRATISHWRTNCSMPKGEMIARIADVFHVSADYLLGRTDDPMDYTEKDVLAGSESPQELIRFQLLWKHLDYEDRIKLEGVVQGLLCADKYKDEILTGGKENKING